MVILSLDYSLPWTYACRTCPRFVPISVPLEMKDYQSLSELLRPKQSNWREPHSGLGQRRLTHVVNIGPSNERKPSHLLMWSWSSGRGILMVLSHQSKTTTRQRQDKSWTCAFLLCLSHQVRQTWCERHNRNAQVQLLSCRCLVVVLLWCESTIMVHYGRSTQSDPNKYLKRSYDFNRKSRRAYVANKGSPHSEK